jgi:hypothetical protein
MKEYRIVGGHATIYEISQEISRSRHRSNGYSMKTVHLHGTEDLRLELRQSRLAVI